MSKCVPRHAGLAKGCWGTIKKCQRIIGDIFGNFVSIMERFGAQAVIQEETRRAALPTD